MKYIPLGLQCSVPNGIHKANMREYSYLFDWLWCPAQTSYNILELLINSGIDSTINYMCSGWSYYKYLENEHYLSIKYKSTCQMNKNTGLGITRFEINPDFKSKIKRRTERLLLDLKSNDKLIFIYADAANPNNNYHLDGVQYGVDATLHLIKIYKLLYKINNNIAIIYFCWPSRSKNVNFINYVEFNHKDHWCDVGDLICDYIKKIENCEINVTDLFTKQNIVFSNIPVPVPIPIPTTNIKKNLLVKTQKTSTILTSNKKAIKKPNATVIIKKF